MKLKENLFNCPWCNNDFEQTVGRVSGAGKKGVAVAQSICPKCGRYVSQKTNIEIKDRIDKGFRI